MDLFKVFRISLPGFFALIFFIGCSSYQSLSCVFVPKQTKETPYPELTEFRNCGQIDKNGKISINKKHFNQIWFNKDGLTDIRIHDGIYYVNIKGSLVRTHYFDNGPDYFKEGLARTVKNNKFGFINKKLDVVIVPKYDFAFPFKNNLSRVCIGCTSKSDGEHKTINGGKWGGD